MSKADEYIERVADLPPAPGIAVQLLGLFDDLDYDIDQVVELISHDPGLTVAVLKRCNSASFSGSEAILDMFEAVTRLGFYEVHCVVAALVGARVMSLGKTEGKVDTSSLWRHSVVTAVAAAALAKRREEAEATAFTAGLLHDVGKLVFASVESAAYANLIWQSGAFGQKLAEAEHATFGVSHASIGSRLLNRWGLPPSVAGAALYHHSSIKPHEPFAPLAATVGLASDLAHRIIDQEQHTSDLLSDRSDAMILFQLTTNDIPTLIQQTQNDLKRVEGLLQMKV
jgi:putative nucleotidyltransferase with HDIG domain